MIMNSHEVPPPVTVPADFNKHVIAERLNYLTISNRILHNHPSGDPTPSSADIQMTKTILGIAAPLGISVHDHIIVGKNGHASLKGLKLI